MRAEDIKLMYHVFSNRERGAILPAHKEGLSCIANGTWGL